MTDQHNMADLLTKAIGDIAAALIMAGKEEKIARWTAPYVEAVNAFDAAAILKAKEQATNQENRHG